MDRLVFVGTELLDGTTGEHQTHHVENTGHSGQCALVEPLRLMGWSESAATHLDRPVDTGVTRCEEMALPIESSISVDLVLHNLVLFCIFGTKFKFSIKVNLF